MCLVSFLPDLPAILAGHFVLGLGKEPFLVSACPSLTITLGRYIWGIKTGYHILPQPSVQC